MDRKDLKNYKYNQQWIKDQMEYIEEQKTRVNKLGAVLSNMPIGSRKVQDSMAEKIAIILDGLNEILNNIVEEENKQKQIIKQLEEIEQPYRLILYKVYIQAKSLVVTAAEMNYNYEYMKKMHGISLSKFEEVTKSY